MKTVVDEIIKASEFFSIIDFKKWFNDEKGRLKEKEKNQIIDAFNQDLYSQTINKMKYQDGEQYYNSTFGDSDEAGI